jgi:hypothetical protein
MIHAVVPTKRGKLKWQDIVKTKEDYTKVFKSGMAYVWWSDFPSVKEFDEYLNNKEKEVESD